MRRAVEQAGADALIVHARKAWLKGLSPKENREVPPLDYDRVYRLKAAHPRLTVVLNGGIAGVEEALAHLARVDGVMMGRAAYQEPWRLLAVDPLVFGEAGALRVAERRPRRRSCPISSASLRRARGCTPSRGICTACSAPCRARARSAAHLAGAATSPQAGAELLAAALALVADAVLDSDRELAHIAA